MFFKILQYLQENNCVVVFFKQSCRACARDIVGKIHEYAYKITLQDFCNGLGTRSNLPVAQNGRFIKT